MRRASLASAVAGLVLASCTSSGTLTPAAASALQVAEADVLEGLPLACDIATVVDPSGATVICAVLDATGAALTTVIKALPSPAAAQAVVAAHPATSAQAAALRARQVPR